jgi:D-alanine-D-alanine ligase
MQHVAVLMGGWSAEREVSLSSGKGVSEALEGLGYRVARIDVQRDIAEVLARLRPDIAFNALHGQFGEDGCIQGVLEVLGIPYTHSGVLASALAMDKIAAKRVFQSADLPIAEHRVLSITELAKGDPLPRPFVVKPISEGSSVGVAILHPGDATQPIIAQWPYGDRVMVETYIPGREIQVAVLDDTALGAIEIVPKNAFYDYEAKYTDGKAQHVMPAPLPPALYQTFLDYALQAHRALGCRGLTRSDFRYDEATGRIVILETNTQPGMTPLSLSPEIAQHVGIAYPELVERLVKGARCGN